MKRGLVRVLYAGEVLGCEGWSNVTGVLFIFGRIYGRMGRVWVCESTVCVVWRSDGLACVCIDLRAFGRSGVW